jgi:hypothetical protein
MIEALAVIGHFGRNIPLAQPGHGGSSSAEAGGRRRVDRNRQCGQLFVIIENTLSRRTW